MVRRLQHVNMEWMILFTLLPLVLGGMLNPTDTITWGGDNSRTGYQTGHNMDPSVVSSSSFGQLFKTLLPGSYGGAQEQIFSQPLVYTLNDGIQYVFVATTMNNLYKINAKTGAIVSSRNMHIPFLTADLDGCTDINPLIGVTVSPSRTCSPRVQLIAIGDWGDRPRYRHLVSYRKNIFGSDRSNQRKDYRPLLLPCDRRQHSK